MSKMASSVGSLTRGRLIRNPNYKRNGLKSYVHALHKWNIEPTVQGPYCMVSHVEQQGSQSLLKKFGSKIGGKAHVSGRSLAKKDGPDGQTGEVPAQDIENQAEYLATVAIGTPAQNLSLDFDTGSSDLWVFSTQLPASTLRTAGSSHTIFDPSKSSTWNSMSGSTWKIQYGDGSGASGTVGTDNLNVGGIVVENQAIELADTLSAQFAQGPGDGLLGLAWPSINTVSPEPVATPVKNMITQSDIPQDQELFTAFLGDTTDESFYTFGYIDQDSIGTQTPTYVSIDNSQGFWEFSTSSATVGEKTITRSRRTAIADTGTTLCLLDDSTCEQIYGQIDGAKQSSQQQGWVFPTSATLPKIGLELGGQTFYIPDAAMKFQDLGDGTYYGGIQSVGNLGMDIWGDVWLRGVYAIFDQGNMRFGCVQRDSTSSSGGAAVDQPSKY